MVSVPSLDEIAGDPSRADGLPPALAASLAVRAASALCALQIAAARVAPASNGDDELLAAAFPT